MQFVSTAKTPAEFRDEVVARLDDRIATLKKRANQSMLRSQKNESKGFTTAAQELAAERDFFAELSFKE